jgi:hypothetical protein
MLLDLVKRRKNMKGGNISASDRHLSKCDASETIYDVSLGRVNILGGHSIGHSKQKFLYAHVSYSEQFPR